MKKDICNVKIKETIKRDKIVILQLIQKPKDKKKETKERY